jgi:signal peptidase I
MRLILRWSREVALTIGAVLGTLCIVLAVVGAVYDVKPLIFRSGSMAPTIPAGGLALAKPVPVAELKVGDIVSVRSHGTRITHRIQAIEGHGTIAALTLKGDANRIHDAEAYRVRSADRVFLHLPYAGYVVSYMTGPAGLLVTGMLVGLLLWLVVRPSRGPGPTTPRGGGRRRAGAACVLVMAAVLAPMSMRPVPTWATFSDQGTVTSGSLAAHTVVRPATIGCSSSLLSATITWANEDPRYDYEVVLRRVSNGNVVSTRQITGASVSTTYAGLTDFGLVVGAGTVDFQVEVRSKLATATSWVSSDVRTYSAIRVLAILVGATASCTT